MAENYVLLETIELNQSASSVTFDNIPQSGYTDLKIVMSARSDGTSFSTPPWQNLSLKLNSTDPSVAKQLYATAAGTGSDSNTSGIWATDPEATASTFSNVEIYLPNYLSSIAKSVSADNITENNATDAARVLWAATYSSVTAAVTSITLTSASGSLLQYSTFSLYGIAASGTTPATGPLASGGNIIANDGTYWYHAFLTSGNFIPSKALTCDYLVVAGGGAGGNAQGGGGGAGGLRSSVTTTGGGGSLLSSISLTSGSPYAIAIGAGGKSPASSTSFPGGDGNNSVIAGSGITTITAVGGGGGGGNLTRTSANGRSGGSGGGGSGDYNSTGGSGTANNGYAGGAGDAGISGNRPSGGGGGAGQAGVAGVLGNAGNGGNGVQITALATATGTGADSGYYAGGGGGGGSAAGSSNPGGLGGGGAGSTTVGANGIYGTGGGGGGSDYTSKSGNGGSGIVIIRYSMAS